MRKKHIALHIAIFKQQNLYHNICTQYFLFLVKYGVNGPALQVYFSKKFLLR